MLKQANDVRLMAIDNHRAQEDHHAPYTRIKRGSQQHKRRERKGRHDGTDGHIVRKVYQNQENSEGCERLNRIDEQQAAKARCNSLAALKSELNREKMTQKSEKSGNCCSDLGCVLNIRRIGCHH